MDQRTTSKRRKMCKTIMAMASNNLPVQQQNVVEDAKSTTKTMTSNLPVQQQQPDKVEVPVVQQRQRQNVGEDAKSTTETMTSNLPVQQQQQQNNLEASSSSTSAEQPATQIKCEACQQTLPRHLFPKKKFAKINNIQTSDTANPTTRNIKIICRRCKKNQTAQRLNQPPKPQIKLGRKSTSGIERRPNNFGYCNYLDQLFSLACFPDIVRLKAFTSAKDVSESMGAIQAACEHGVWKNKNAKKKSKMKGRVKCLCIGDGSTPRTAVLACYLKGWECISIDPALHEEWHGVSPKGVRGLTGYGGMLEDYLTTQSVESENGFGATKYDHLILLCVHSHARLMGRASVPNIMARYDNIPTTLISLPCCPKFRSQKDVGRVPDVRYEDDCVFSACRRVEVWKFDYTQCFVCAEATA